jgi:Spy/CpxP family protein refolding chaperone
MKKLILSVATVGMIATVALAQCNGTGATNNPNCDGKGPKGEQANGKSCAKSGDYKDYRRHNGTKSGPTNVMFAISSINLSEKQKDSLREVMSKYSKAKRENFNKFSGNYASAKYFTKDGFDSKKFIDDRKANRDELVKIKADFYTGLYNVLDPKQKEEFVKALSK